MKTALDLDGRASTGLAATTRAIAGAQVRAEVARAPRRLAQWRLRTLDRLLEDIEQLRLSGERRLPEDVRTMITAFARTHDPGLLHHLAAAPAHVDTAHDAVFDAQGRVMLELASLRSGPRWDETAQLFQQDEAA